MLKDLLISSNCSLTNALELLSKTAKKILFVHEDSMLIGSVTDGDIRRWILANGNLNTTAKNFANFSPKFLTEKDQLTAKKYMEQNHINALPITDSNKKILSVIFSDDFQILNQKTMNVPVVIMAGGYGTRLYPYTKILPKPLIPIGETPIIEHIINRFRSFGCDNFHLIVNHKKNMIKAYFYEIERDYRISYVEEDTPLGTGGGLSLLKGKINSTFILTNCDMLIEEDYEKIYSFHKKERNKITVVCSLNKFTIPYGVVELNSDGKYNGMLEKPEICHLINTGFYIVEPDIIDNLKDGKAVGFPEIIESNKSSGGKVGVYPISEHTWMDMGQIDKMEEMLKRFDLQ